MSKGRLGPGSKAQLDKLQAYAFSFQLQDFAPRALESRPLEPRPD